MNLEKDLNAGERQKLAELEAFRLSRLGTNDLLDKLTRLMGQLLNVPTSMVTLLGSDRLWIKAKRNFRLDETERDGSFCQRTVERNDLVIVEDTRLDSEFKSNALVTSDPHIRFYAGAPLKTADGHVVGEVCIIDYHPRQLGDEEGALLKSFADIASGILESSNHIGFIDPVTLLPNRQKLMRDIGDLNACSREPHTLILLETVRQEYYYDLARSFGIDEIENIFSKIARLLESSLPRSQTLYSGMTSRFSILVPSESKEQVLEILKAFERRMQKELHFKLPVRLVFRSGYYDFNPSTVKARTAFRRAFCAFCNALASDLPISHYRLSYDREQRKKLRLTDDIRTALTRPDQLYLAYQPKVCLKTSRIVGFEALLRWKHPKWGDISPADFIPLVSTTALINPLTLWVIRQASLAIKQFEALGAPVPVSVNVTMTNLIDDQFVDKVLEILGEFDIKAELLEIECLETEELLNSSQAVETLNTLRKYGICIALDDFGSGYSNLIYLRSLPAQVVKIDKSLISTINTDTASHAIVAHVIQLLQELSFEVVAEGVEDAPTAEKLERFGCDIAQGYFFYRPMPLEEALHVLHSQG